MSDIVPFGKYKGNPVEVMLADQDYCGWLVSQDWFKNRFQPIYNVIIQGVSEPQDSPEHNAMQVKFLSSEYRTRFLAALGKSAPFPVNAEFEVGREQIDVVLSMSGGLTGVSTKEEREYAHRMSMLRDVVNSNGITEAGWDVFRQKLKGEADHILGVEDAKWSDFKNGVEKISGVEFVSGFQISVEIKPTVGDDFPKILRQIKSKAKHPEGWVVAYDRFTATTVTVAEVATIFAPIRLVCVNEL